MIEIHTPDAWYSIFNNPSLYIEDNGLIYTADQRYNLLPQASGKIDFEKGYVYGNDYVDPFCQPIGQIKTRHDGVKMIYGTDYHRLSAQPILYIRDNRIYEASQFFKSFPMEAAFIKENKPTPPDNSNRHTGGGGGGSTGGGGGGFSSSGDSADRPNLLRIILIALAVLGMLIAGAYFTLTSEDFGTPSIIMLAVGTVIALIFSKDLWITPVLIILCSTGVQMFIYDYITTSSHKTLGVGELIISIIFYPFAIILTYAIPAVILGTLVWLIKRPFYKKKGAQESAQNAAESK